MKKTLLAAVALIFSMIGFAQTYLSENFSTATGTTPPTGWANVDSTTSGEIWTFK